MTYDVACIKRPRPNTSDTGEGDMIIRKPRKRLHEHNITRARITLTKEAIREKMGTRSLGTTEQFLAHEGYTVEDITRPFGCPKCGKRANESETRSETRLRPYVRRAFR